LLHFQEQKAAIISNACNTKLKQHHPNYNKGLFNKEFKNRIEEKQAKAVNRASRLTDFENPSSQLYKFISELEKVKKKKEL
jgi:hypothetical protein